jgi:hypothetical protein
MISSPLVDRPLVLATFAEVSFRVVAFSASDPG